MSNLLGLLARRAKKRQTGPSDPLFASVRYLANFSASANDVKGHTSTLNGAASVVGGALELPGAAADYLRVAHDSQLYLAASNWCIEGYITVDAMTTVDAWMGVWWQAGKYSWLFNYTKNTNNLLFALSTNGSNVITSLSATIALTAGQKYHFCALRSGSTIAVYIGGTRLVTYNIGATAVFDPTTVEMWLGNNHDATAQSTDGRIHCARITIGNSRYGAAPASFTPDSDPFPEA